MRIPLASLKRLRSCATTNRLHWERRRWGVEGYPLDVAIEPGRLRETVSRRSRGESVVRSPNHVPLNLTAHCKQQRKFCQEKIEEKAQNVVAACSICLPLVVKFQFDTSKERAACGDHSGFLSPRTIAQKMRDGESNRLVKRLATDSNIAFSVRLVPCGMSWAWAERKLRILLLNVKLSRMRLSRRTAVKKRILHEKLWLTRSGQFRPFRHGNQLGYRC